MRRVQILSAAITANSIELLLADSADERVGVEVVHGYTIMRDGPTWGDDTDRIIELIEDLGEEVHARWKREPKPEK